MASTVSLSLFFFFNDTATTEIYTLSLHDALPICVDADPDAADLGLRAVWRAFADPVGRHRELERSAGARSEEHTSELQSQSNLVCRLLLEKKKQLNVHAPASVPDCCHRIHAIDTR